MSGARPRNGRFRTRAVRSCLRNAAGGGRIASSAGRTGTSGGRTQLEPRVVAPRLPPPVRGILSAVDAGGGRPQREN
jgi:hypothetical protein